MGSLSEDETIVSENCFQIFIRREVMCIWLSIVLEYYDFYNRFIEVVKHMPSLIICYKGSALAACKDSTISFNAIWM